MRAGLHRGAVNVTDDDDVLGHVVNLRPGRRVGQARRAPGHRRRASWRGRPQLPRVRRPDDASLQGHRPAGAGRARRLAPPATGARHRPSLRPRQPRTTRDDQSMETTMITPGIDHIALNVPDLDAQIERLTTAMGLVVEHRFGDFALISDPTNGLKPGAWSIRRRPSPLPSLWLSRRRRRQCPPAARGNRHGDDGGAAPPRLRCHVHVVPAAAGMRRRPARQLRPARRTRHTRRALTSRGVQIDRRSGLTPPPCLRPVPVLRLG